MVGSSIYSTLCSKSALFYHTLKKLSCYLALENGLNARLSKYRIYVYIMLFLTKEAFDVGGTYCGGQLYKMYSVAVVSVVDTFYRQRKIKRKRKIERECGTTDLFSVTGKS